MPRKSSATSEPGKLLDSWGRANRVLNDKSCAQCGSMFRPARATSAYCCVKCARKKNGGQNKKLDGTWWTNGKGYAEGRLEGARIKRHRLVAQEGIGRPLLPTEDVHHKNGDKLDNTLDNLEVVDHGAHARLHNGERVYKRGYKLNLSDAERKARSERMTAMRRATIAKATGEAS